MCTRYSMNLPFDCGEEHPSAQGSDVMITA